VAEISDELFNFVPKNNNPGFRKFIDYINSKQAEVYSDAREIVDSKIWKKCFLKDIEPELSFPDLDEPARVSRVKTEEETPKKTLRRSVKK